MTSFAPIPGPDETVMAGHTLGDDADDGWAPARGEREPTPRERVVAARGVLAEHRVAIGTGIGVAVAALLLVGITRRRRHARPPSVAGAIVRSLAREAIGRLVLGAAATAGARLAEAAIPVLVAKVSARAAQRSRPTRARKARSPAAR